MGTPLLFCFLCHLQSIPFGFRLWGDDKGAEIFQTCKGTKEIIRQFQHFAEFIQQLLDMAKEIMEARQEGKARGLDDEELAFYDALTKPQAIKDFYANDELVAITRELTDTLRRNRTIDWQKKDDARARMRRSIKRLLKKHKYPPDEVPEAIETVMQQCELWVDYGEGN